MFGFTWRHENNYSYILFFPSGSLFQQTNFSTICLWKKWMSFYWKIMIKFDIISVSEMFPFETIYYGLGENVA